MVLPPLQGCYKAKKLEAMTVTGDGIGLIKLFLFYISNMFIHPSTELLNQQKFIGSFLYARTLNGWDIYANVIPSHPHSVTKRQT